MLRSLMALNDDLQQNIEVLMPLGLIALHLSVGHVSLQDY